MANSAVIQVEGAKEFRKAVKGYETDTSWRPLFRTAYSTVAQAVAAGMQSQAQATTRIGSAGAASISGKGTVTNATIKAFNGIPYGPGFNFGSHRFRQFGPVTKPDHFMYAYLASHNAQIREQVQQALDAQFASDGLG